MVRQTQKYSSAFHLTVGGIRMLQWLPAKNTLLQGHHFLQFFRDIPMEVNSTTAQRTFPGLHEKFVVLVTASSIFQRGWYGWVENHYTEDAYHKCITIVNYSSYCYCYLIIVIAIGTAIVVFIVIYYHAFIWWENHCNMYRIMNHSIFNLIFWRAIFQLLVDCWRVLTWKMMSGTRANMNFRSQNQGLFSGGGSRSHSKEGSNLPVAILEERDLNETYAFEFASSWSCLKLSRWSVDQLISRWSKATPQSRASFPFFVAPF